MKQWLRVGVVGVCVWSAIVSAEAGTKVIPAVPGELVARLSSAAVKSSVSFEVIARDLQNKLGLKALPQIRHFKTSNEFATFHFQEKDMASIASLLKHDSRLAYVEPNFIYHTFESRAPGDLVPNDAQFAALWGMKNAGAADSAGHAGKAGSDIHVTEAWAEGITGSKNVKVAVIDTGVDYTHPDLTENVDQADGWNFYSNVQDPKDDNMHGTHCSGTIGAVGNNGVGVAGVNWHVTIIPVKFLSAGGSGSLDAAVQAIQWATSKGVQIMSNSWGGGGFSQAMLDAITDAKKHGILFVAAAGNDGSNNDSSPTYPASYAVDNIVAVAATDNTDTIADFSNYGRTTVHVAAPGVNILSTIKDGGYAVLSGTSMATPHVSGIAALLLSANPSLTYAQIKETLIKTSDPVRGLAHKVVAKGRVNVHNALHGIMAPSDGPDDTQWKDVSMHIETPHPYENSKTYDYPISVPGAKYLRVVFDSIDTEPNYDKVVVKQANGDKVESVSGKLSNYVTDYLEGSQATVSLISDSSNNGVGFTVSKVQAIY